jgi:hypothetical protein
LAEMLKQVSDSSKTNLKQMLSNWANLQKLN